MFIKRDEWEMVLRRHYMLEDKVEQLEKEMKVVKKAFGYKLNPRCPNMFNYLENWELLLDYLDIELQEKQVSKTKFIKKK